MSDFKEYAGDFVDASRGVYGDYGYAAGYFQSLAVEMFRYLPVAEQQRFLRQMRDAADKMVDSIDA
jgi:hypothetical protein